MRLNLNNIVKKKNIGRYWYLETKVRKTRVEGILFFFCMVSAYPLVYPSYQSVPSSTRWKFMNKWIAMAFPTEPDQV